MAGNRTSILDPAPPDTTGGGDRGKWAWLLTAKGIVEAELVRGVLEGAGVPVALDGRDSSPFAWMYPGGNINVLVRVLVPAGLLDTARLYLLEAGIAGDVSEGTEISSPEKSRMFRFLQGLLTTAVLLAALWIVFVTFLGRATCALKIYC